MTRFKSVKFKGLKLLTKYNIISGAGIKINSNHILVNKKRLKSFLGRKSLIKNYKLIDKKKTLIIMVVEKVPFAIVAVKEGERTFLCEIDGQFNVISLNTVYGKNLPVILMTDKQFSSGQFNDNVKELFFQFRNVKRHITVWTELSEIDIRRIDNIFVKVRGRKTKFSINNSLKSFRQLDSLVAYLDKLVFFPEYLKIENNFVVIK